MGYFIKKFKLILIIALMFTPSLLFANFSVQNLLNFNSANSSYAQKTAAAQGGQNLGTLFTNLSADRDNYKVFVEAFMVVCACGFMIATVFKFKQYKDNPTQIPISTPFALLFVSIFSFSIGRIVQPATNTIFTGIDPVDCQSKEYLPGDGC
jgi:hypothetical protein